MFDTAQLEATLVYCVPPTLLLRKDYVAKIRVVAEF